MPKVKKTEEVTTTYKQKAPPPPAAEFATQSVGTSTTPQRSLELLSKLPAKQLQNEYEVRFQTEASQSDSDIDFDDGNESDDFDVPIVRPVKLLRTLRKATGAAAAAIPQSERDITETRLYFLNCPEERKFNARYPKSFFCLLEYDFKRYGIESQTDKFYRLVCGLNENQLGEICTALPEASDLACYDKLKKLLLERFTEPPHERLKSLTMSEKLSKPMLQLIQEAVEAALAKQNKNSGNQMKTFDKQNRGRRPWYKRGSKHAQLYPTYNSEGFCYYHAKFGANANKCSNKAICRFNA